MSRRGKRGKGWERSIQLVTAEYRCRVPTRVVVHKTEPGVRNIRGKLVYAEKGPPDFVGTLDDRAVAFDAKESRRESGRWYLSNLKRHQAADLEAHMSAGAFAFIALRLYRAGAAWVIPWRVLSEPYFKGDLKSINAEDCERLGYKMPPIDLAGVPVPFDDWVAAARAALQGAPGHHADGHAV